MYAPEARRDKRRLWVGGDSKTGAERAAPRRTGIEDASGRAPGTRDPPGTAQTCTNFSALVPQIGQSFDGFPSSMFPQTGQR